MPLPVRQQAGQTARTTRLPRRGARPLARTGHLSLPTAATRRASDWTDLWGMIWPLMLAMVLQLSVGLLDTWIAGRISPAAQAVVGLALQVLFMITTATIALSVGCQALVARMVGAEDWRGAAHVVQQTLLLGLGLSLALVVPLVACAPTLFTMIGASPAVAAEGSTYLRWLAVGLLPMNLGLLLNGILRARGLMGAQLRSAGVEALVWVAGSWVLGYMLDWGLMGLAAGFVAGKAAGAWMAWSHLRTSRLADWDSATLRPDKVLLKRILRVGLPTGAQTLLRTVCGLLFYAILGLAAMPNEAVAAYAIGFRLESVGYLMLFALSLSASTLVGQNLGANQPQEAVRACWRLLRVALVGMGALGAVCYAAAEPLADLFTADPLVWAYTCDYLRVTALGAPFLALTVVLNGAFQGAGATRTTLVCALLAQLLCGLPLAYVLCGPLDWGPAGAWWGLTAALVAQGLMLGGCFLKGNWRERHV